ncbi:CobW family GTP-binding protein [Williamsia sterculiae]|uniref:GTPase, G3E family n=1 Tax=Williamsia sterculiae TaxID=1344003 RepID=A0A1N7FUM6_9NOCA|nr:CobW family GTP-binding protein [Williamsia sterculiae]SIS03957.1 GTPase, G3E family [Williamsia sterculiae]
MTAGVPSSAPTPVLVVAGFLGAGKTTLLNHLLRTADGTRIGVVVNDFGAINIDALLVAGQSESTLSLGNGCICCSVDDSELADALSDLARPALALDLIVIEASGLAEPRNLVRMVLGLDDRRLRYGGLVYVVDAANVVATLAEHRGLGAHLALADLIVVNKADLTRDVDGVRSQIRRFNPTAALLRTVGARVPTELLVDPSPRAPSSGPEQLGLDALMRELETDDCARDDDHSHDHLHDAYQSVSFATRQPLRPRALARFLERPPDGAYRIKGVADFDIPGHRDRYEVHAVGGHVGIRARRWRPDEDRRTRLVVIGAGLDEAVARHALAELQRPDDEPVDRQSMVTITRYLPAAGTAEPWIAPDAADAEPL